MTTKQKLAVWLGALVMLAAWWPAAADAAITCKNVRGLQVCHGSIWNNELAPGAPVMEFPRNCAASGTCQYTVNLDFFPAADPATCVQDPTTSWQECREEPSCLVWVQFSPSILPIPDFHGGQDLDNAVIMEEIDDGVRPKRLGFVFGNHDAFHGAGYQIMAVTFGELEIFRDQELCRVGLIALYHQDSRAIANRLLLGP